MAIIGEKWIEMLEKKADGTYVAKYPKVKSKSGVTFDEHLADDMTKAGGTFTGITTAYSNTSYTVRQMRNIILSTGDAVLASMQDGDIWIKYK